MRLVTRLCPCYISGSMKAEYGVDEWIFFGTVLHAFSLVGIGLPRILSPQWRSSYLTMLVGGR